ncbi:hypothetical protein SEA_KEANU_11 [Streptomyces phage Keanu]|nr:hypothetical protein SEA_KEANU_11 [Streptomyces phage Keanu]
MSDENTTPDETQADEPQSYRYYNLNNGDVVERDRKQPRFEFLQNWVRVRDDNHLSELQEGNDRNGRGNLLGSSSIGDRKEPRHQVPTSTFEPKVEYTEPSKNELRGNHPDAEDYHIEKQPEVITVDPSKQVQPIAGEGKRDLSAVVLDENLDMNPASKPVGAGADDGVLARAHPELEGVEERRQAMIKEQQASQTKGDGDAGHTAVRERPANGDDASTKHGVTQGQETADETRGEPNPANRPARSATKEAWVDWAVECGADRSDAKNMTKQDLIEVYGD